MQEALQFDPEEGEDKTIADFLLSPPDGQFSVSGEIKWLEYHRMVNVRCVQKRLREAQIQKIDSFDCLGSLKLISLPNQKL